MFFRSMTAAAALCALAVSTPTLAKSKSAAQFVPDAIAGDIGEIEMGQLAQSNGGSADVKAFGQTLMTDHTAAKNEMTDLAKRNKYPVPTQAKADARKEFKRLQGLKSAAFDREFVRHMISDHRKDVAAFQSFADGNKGEAADLARKQLPTLKKHLQTAQQLGSSPGEGAASGTVGAPTSGPNTKEPPMKPSSRM